MLLILQFLPSFFVFFTYVLSILTEQLVCILALISLDISLFINVRPIILSINLLIKATRRVIQELHNVIQGFSVRRDIMSNLLNFVQLQDRDYQKTLIFNLRQLSSKHVKQTWCPESYYSVQSLTNKAPGDPLYLNLYALNHETPSLLTTDC